MATNVIGNAVQEILRLLSQDTSKMWSVATLASELSQREVYTNERRLSVIIESLIAGGLANGDRRRNVWYKDPQTADGRVTKEHMKAVTDALNKRIADLELGLRKSVEDLKAARARAEEAQSQILEVHVKEVGKATRKVKGIFHREFATLTDLANARENILMYGPTGSGKTTIGRQVAAVLGLKFGFVSVTTGMSEGVLQGKLLPVGAGGRFEYIISEFIKSFETGGVFLLDEFDAGDANVLLVINTALANDVIAVSNRPKKPYAYRHKDFVCMAAANTLGTNADRMYTGRNKLDTSTLDRFGIGKVLIDYDVNVETQLCPSDELRERCWRIRKAINDHQLERAMSTRFLEKSYKMMQEPYSWTYERVDKSCFAGWRPDEFNKVNNSARLGAEMMR